jgi:hypothetical protein
LCERKRRKRKKEKREEKEREKMENGVNVMRASVTLRIWTE